MLQNHKFVQNPILRLTFEFSLEVVEFSEKLEIQKKYNLANQLFKSRTSIGANSNEAQNSESRADFIHKIKLAAKEACETEYWLLLCEHSKNYPSTVSLLRKLEEIQKLLNSIITISKRNSEN